jgi:hypothetical protein
MIDKKRSIGGYQHLIHRPTIIQHAINDKQGQAHGL